MAGAIFLDRDGVLCENRPTYVKSWEEFRWIPGAREALRILARLDVPVVIVTNQSAINRGLTTAARVDEMHRRMTRTVRRWNGRLDAIYVCPHRPDEGCSCRKPGVLLFHQAAGELRVDLPGSYLIGDGMADVEAGLELKLRVVLVRTGLGEQTLARLDGASQRVHTVSDVLEAARLIHAEARPRPAQHTWPWHRPPVQQRSHVDAQGGGRR